jgi:hypothetical protein
MHPDPAPAPAAASPSAEAKASVRAEGVDFMTALAGLGGSSPVPHSARDKVVALEDSLKAIDRPIEFELRHFFANGVYVRELIIPAGVVLTGQIHKHEHIAICTQGEISIFDEAGLRRVKAGDVFVSRPGIKRAGYAHSETRFLNVLRMSNPEERDLQVLEAEFVAGTVAEYEAWLSLTQGTAEAPRALPPSAREAVVEAG